MFWIIASILILIALAFVLPSLLRKQRVIGGAVDARRKQNIQIAKEQLEDLEHRFEKGEMEEDAYQSTRDELEMALFEDMKESTQDAQLTNKVSSVSVVGSFAIALLVPLIAVGMYTKLGSPVFTTDLSSQQAAKQELEKNVPKNADGTPDIDTMVAGLQKKMEANPNNPEGWFMLGRSYMVMKRYPEAAKAYEQAYKLQPESTDVMLSLADSLAMASNGSIKGRPTELINKVLEIEPDNLTGLWLGGMASRQQGDYVTAIKRWNGVLSQLKSPAEKQEVNSLIAESMKQLTPEQQAVMKTDMASTSTTDQAPKAMKTSDTSVVDKNNKNGNGISVTVSLSEKLKSQTQPTDLVFVYAKAVTGPPMPLAAARKQVKDLPLEIVLDDSMAMIPTMKLSGFSEVIVGARVSKSGQPIAQNGDLFVEKKPVKAGEKVVLEIDSIVNK